MSSPLFVQDSISRAQSASPFPWSPTQDGFTIPSISSVRSVQGSPDRVQFRFKRRFCILTYSQVPPDFPHERISEGIHRDGGLCTVSRELHKDGGTHYHAFVDYQRVRDWTGQSRWDVAGHHPNITPVSRTPYKALEYVSKDCDITHDCFDESNRPRRDSGRPKGNGKRKWSEIISAPDENSFLESLKENDPRALVVCHGNVRQYIGWRYPAERRHYESPTGLSIRIDIDERIKAFSSRIGQRGRYVLLQGAAPPCTPCHAGATRAPCTPLRHIVILEYCVVGPWRAGSRVQAPYRGAVNQSHPCLLNCRLIRKQAEIIDPMGTDEDWEDTFVPQLR